MQVFPKQSVCLRFLLLRACGPFFLHILLPASIKLRSLPFLAKRRDRNKKKTTATFAVPSFRHSPKACARASAVERRRGACFCMVEEEGRPQLCRVYGWPQLYRDIIHVHEKMERDAFKVRSLLFFFFAPAGRLLSTEHPCVGVGETNCECWARRCGGCTHWQCCERFGPREELWVCDEYATRDCPNSRWLHRHCHRSGETRGLSYRRVFQQTVRAPFHSCSEVYVLDIESRKSQRGLPLSGLRFVSEKLATQ